jgi:type IV conjugative transfer system coupling protein TraD
VNNNSSGFRDFTRGGQIFTHALLMLWQVFRGGLIVAFIVFCSCFYGFISNRATSYDWYIYGQTIVVELRLMVHDHRVMHTIHNPDNSRVNIRAVDFIHCSKTRFHVDKCKKAFWSSLWQSGLISLSVLALYFIYLKRKGKQENQNIQIDGQEQVDPKTLRQLLERANKASPFKLAGAPLVKRSETQHVLLAGTTGTGKSVAMQELMDQVRKKGQRAIVYDIDGAFIPAYYRPGKDILLNPLDTRVPAWNIWQECRDLADFDTAALSLMPEHLAGTDPFWIRSAHTIFSCAALKLQTHSHPKTRMLLEPIFAEGLQSLGSLVTGTPAAPLVLEQIDKTALSIKATLSTYCKSLMYLKEEGKKPLFSIRRWIEADEGDSWLFIASNAQKIDALRPLLSVWLDVAAKSMLSLKASHDRRLWFFLDELPSLHKLPSLMNALSRGRKYGACFVAAIQDVHQLHAIYGKNHAESLTSLFNTKVFYRTQEPDSAHWMSKVIGNREIIERKEGFSYGAHEMRDGVSIHEERRQEPIVKLSAFLALEDLNAFLRLPGNWPVAQLAFEIKARRTSEQAFMARDLSQLLKEDKSPDTLKVLQEPQKSEPQKAPEENGVNIHIHKPQKIKTKRVINPPKEFTR